MPKLWDALMKGIRAFHGSPYDFDRFDISKLGTGEGNAVYGHGLYFAENPKVAEAYKRSLTGLNPNSMGSGKAQFGVGGVPMPQGISGHAALDTGQEMDLLLGIMHSNPESTLIPHLKQKIERRIADHYSMQQGGSAGDDMRAMAKYYNDFVKNAKPEDVKTIAPGRMYEVNIRADPEQLLDWDKSFSQQSKSVQEATLPWLEEGQLRADKARQFLLDRGTDSFGRPLTAERIEKLNAPRVSIEEMPGSDIYKRSGLYDPVTGTPARDQQQGWLWASGRLNEAGIPGIRYLDQGSRLTGDAARIAEKYGGREAALPVAQERLKSAGLGDLQYWDKVVNQLSEPQTSNYVMFNDNLIDILKKYGIAGVAPMAAGFGFQQPTDNQQSQ